MIKIYTVPNCRYCNEAKNIMIELNVPYEEYNLRKDREARKYYRSLGVKYAPIIVNMTNNVEKWKILKYDRAELLRLLRQDRYEK